MHHGTAAKTDMLQIIKPKICVDNIILSHHQLLQLLL